MGIFSKIKERIFGKPAGAQAVPTGAPASGPQVATAAQAQPGGEAPVDVEQILIAIAKGKGNPDLNWRSSIIDLMKLLDLDSSLANRRELAAELGYAGAKDGSAEMNIWLHRAVMNQLAANGGKVPASMVD